MSQRRDSGGPDGDAVRVLPPEASSRRRTQDSEPPRRPTSSFGWVAAVLGIGAIWLGFTLTTPADPPPSSPPPATTVPSLAAPPVADAAPPAAGQMIVAPVESSAATWTSAKIDDVTGIVAIETDAGRIAALATTEAGPQILTSSTGAGWTVADGFERPDGDARFLDLVEHDGRLFAFGTIGDEIVAWTSDTAVAWSEASPIATLSSPLRLVAVSNGATLLVLTTEQDGPLRGWASEDGTEWRLAEAAGLTRVADATTLDGWFYVAGSRCVAETCRPAIVRSEDGVIWHPTSGVEADIADAVDARRGIVSNIATTHDGLIALGHVPDGDSDRIVIWLSTDGERFVEAPETSAFGSRTINVRVSSIADGPEPRVQLTIDGAAYDLAEGESLSTPYGSIAVATIVDDRVEIESPAGSQGREMQAGDVIAMTSAIAVIGLDAEGRRVVAVGIDVSSAIKLPLAWVSTDGGLGWERVTLPAPAGAAAEMVVVKGANVAVLGVGGSGVVGWSGRWRTETQTFAAERTIRRFVAAVESGDADVVRSILATSPDSSVASLPTLGVVDLADEWRSPETGVLQMESVAKTLDYVAAAGTTIDIVQCRSSVSFGAVDAITVHCDYAATSRLLSTFGLEATKGVLAVHFRDGVMRNLSASDDTAPVMWQTLARWTATAHPEHLASLGAETVTGRWELAPTLNAEAALLHIALAEELATQRLAPGQTTVAASPLGLIEWTWIESPLGSDHWLAGPIPTPDGYVATSFSANDSGGAGLWRSPDGFAWTQVPSPDVDWLGEPHLFDGGILLVGQRLGVSGLWAVHGDEWVEVDIDRAAATANGGLQIIGVVDGAALVRATSWNASGELIDERTGVVAPDLTYEEVNLPEGMYADNEAYFDVAAAAGGEGLTMLSHRYGDAPSIWHTSDLRSWDKLGEVPELARTGIFAFAVHQDRYVAIVWREEETCRETAAGTVCENPVEVWASPTGAGMERIGRLDQVGFFSAGIGEPGFFGVSTVQTGNSQLPFRIMYSANGTAWAALDEPLVADITAAWSWAGNVTVGADRVLISIELDRSSRDGGGFRPVGSLLVGRFVES